MLVWGAAGGLLLTAVLPAPSGLSSPAAESARWHSPHRPADPQAPSAPEGIVFAQTGQGPDLMHRKHQEDGPGDRVWLRPAGSNAEIAQLGDPRETPDALALSARGPQARGRNTPLRL